MTLSYDEFVQLELNREIVRARKTVQLVDALEVASGKRSLPEEWLRWLTPDPSEAARLIAEQNRSLLAK